MAPNATVKTDSPEGKGGVLTVKALVVNGVKKPPGVYTTASEKWIVGTGKVIVLPEAWRPEKKAFRSRQRALLAHAVQLLLPLRCS